MNAGLALHGALSMLLTAPVMATEPSATPRQRSAGCRGRLCRWSRRPDRACPQSVGGSGSADPAFIEAKVERRAVRGCPSCSGSVRGDYSYQIGAPEGKSSVSTFRSSGVLSLNQLVWDFGRLSGRIAAAQASAEASLTDEKRARRSSLSTMSNFYAVLQAEALLSVASENLQQQTRRLKRSESFFQNRHQAADRCADCPNGGGAGQAASAAGPGQCASDADAVLQALGLPERTGEAGTSDRCSRRCRHRIQSKPRSATRYRKRLRRCRQVVERTLQARPDYQSLLARVRQSEAQLKAAKSDYLPSLSLGASATMNSGTFGGVSGLDVTTQTLPGLLVSGTVGLTWPVFTGLSTVYAVRDARAQLALAEANLTQLRLQVRSQLQQALQQVLTAWLTVEAAVAVANQAKSSSDGGWALSGRRRQRD